MASPADGGTVRHRGGPAVDSRWWYWIAAVPAAFAFWIVAIAWVSVALGLGPIGGSNPVGRAATVSLVAFGVPFLTLVAVFPFAVYADASAVLAADVGWQPRRAGLTAAGAIGPVATLVAGAADLLADGAFDTPGWAVAVGFLLTVPVAVWYLVHRHLGSS